MGSKPNGKPTKTDAWQPKPGNRPKISVFTGAHARKVQDHERQMQSMQERRARLQAQLTKVQADLEAIDLKITEAEMPDWVETIAKPVAKALSEMFSDVSTEVLMLDESAVVVLSQKDRTIEQKLIGAGTKSMVLVPLDLKDSGQAIGVRDFTASKKQEVAAGSLASLKGLCYPTKTITGENTIGELIPYLQ